MMAMKRSALTVMLVLMMVSPATVGANPSLPGGGQTDAPAPVEVPSIFAELDTAAQKHFVRRVAETFCTVAKKTFSRRETAPDNYRTLFPPLNLDAVLNDKTASTIKQRCQKRLEAQQAFRQQYTNLLEWADTVLGDTSVDEQTRRDFTLTVSPETNGTIVSVRGLSDHTAVRFAAYATSTPPFVPGTVRQPVDAGLTGDDDPVLELLYADDRN